MLDDKIDIMDNGSRHFSVSAIFKKASLVIQPFLAIAVFIIAILQYQQAEKQSRMAELQTEIIKHQQKITSIQESLDLLMFVREYINGFVYLYDVVTPKEADVIVNEIRSAGLPAIAVPSQYSPDHLLVITHSLGHFNNAGEARNEILKWKKIHKIWEYMDKPKTQIFDKYENKWRNKDVTDLVFFYKADIITHKQYFEKLARSKEFIVKEK